MATARKIRKTPAPAPKPAKKSVARKASPRPDPPREIAAAKSDKPKKAKLVRDSFTIPKLEFNALQDLKQRAARGGNAAKKSEILRAGIMALAAMGDAAFSAALQAVPAIKTGRPAKE
jgi:hypothetical protein